MVVESSPKQRPQHHRNASSKSGLFRSIVSAKSRPASPDSSIAVVKSISRSQTVPLLPPGHPHAAKKGVVLGERQSNMQSPPPSPSKDRKSVANKSTKDDAAVESPSKSAGGSPYKKAKSSTNVSAVFARMNRSNKDLAQAKDKENTTPPTSSSARSVESPIWAQFATTLQHDGIQVSGSMKNSDDLQNEIAKYTPQNYSPGKQRNFNGSMGQAATRPTLSNRRPHSTYAYTTESGITASGPESDSTRAVKIGGGRHKDTRHQLVHNKNPKGSQEQPSSVGCKGRDDRKASASSTEQAPSKEKLNITKRGGRVLAAVAALQGKPKIQDLDKVDPVPDVKLVDEQFEAVLAARQIPETMRQKMRALTLRVKMDFVKQDQELHQEPQAVSGDISKSNCSAKVKDPDGAHSAEDDSTSTKRSRARSRTFTFSKAEKRSDGSPSKKQRSQSRSRPISIHVPKETTRPTSSTPTTPTTGSFGRQNALSAVPAEYITYLRETSEPTRVEVGRLHKLRLLLRNETVAWVDSFISQGGMSEIVALLRRIVEMEWREEHEDQLLHETLLCLKGLCTTERAMAELDKIADTLFPTLLGMLFGEEKKGPAEYTTRTIITTVLFNYLAAATSSTAADLERRARRILTFLSEPQKPDHDRPVDFVLDMRTPRPYRLWCREVSNVTKEVFWIFLHRLNVVPSPRPSTSQSSTSGDAEDPIERNQVLAATYTRRHFPGTRPPVPAAPYIGGVEWDATTYLTSHLDLLNGLIASLPTPSSRQSLRSDLLASGFEKVMGATLRTCKEKFYCGVHDGLKAWVAAASEDGWDTRFVREGPTDEEVAQNVMKSSPKKSPNKKKDAPPQIEALPAPRLELDLQLGRIGYDRIGERGDNDHAYDDDNGWLE